MIEPRRISNAAGHGVPITVEYSSVSSFSLDGKRLLLLHNYHFAEYNEQGFVRDLPMLAASCEPRWGRTNPSLLYYLYQNEIRSLDLESGEIATIKKFGEYQAIGSKGEADISEDGDHLAIIGDERFVFVYEISTGRKGRVLDIKSRRVESLYLAADNSVIVSWIGTGGIDLFDHAMSFQRKLFNSNGHKDVGVTPDGRHVMAITNSNENPVTLPDFPNGIVLVDLATGTQTGLLSLDWSMAVHLSCCLDGIVVSTYGAAVRQDAPHADEIFFLSYDGAIEPLCKHGSIINSYTDQPKASASYDGKRIVFCRGDGSTTDTWLIDRGAVPPPDEPPDPPPTDNPLLDELEALVAKYRAAQ